MDQSAPILYLFAKAPLPGAVKTRMQPGLTADACADLAATMCRRIGATLAGNWRGETVIKAAPDTTHSLFADLSRRHGFGLEAQTGSDLGERMWEALDRGIRRCGKAAVIGADVPHVSPEVIREAHGLMADGANVIGPATDGGFYFLGLVEAAPDLFRGVRWGEEAVLATVLERAESMNVKFQRLPALRDIDRFDDLKWLAGQDSHYQRFLRAAPCYDVSGVG